jgi:hypothetical protein
MIAKAFRFAKTCQQRTLKVFAITIRFAIMQGAALFYGVKYEPEGLGTVAAVENFGVCLD